VNSGITIGSAVFFYTAQHTQKHTDRQTALRATSIQ